MRDIPTIVHTQCGGAWWGIKSLSDLATLVAEMRTAPVAKR